MDHFAFGHESYIRADGRVQFEGINVTPTLHTWRYQMGSVVLAADLLADAIKSRLQTVGYYRQTTYSLSLIHAVVLYPQYITANDLRGIRQEIHPDRYTYHLEACLPFGDELHRSRVIIDPAQTEVLEMK